MVEVIIQQKIYLNYLVRIIVEIDIGNKII
jgi:hypothetical protein